MGIDFYWASGSPFAWRVMLALEHKGLAYTSHLLSFARREHKTAAYLALNPRGQVPTLVDGEAVLCESLAILAYLEKQYPEPALFGHGGQQSALIWQLFAEHVAYLDEAMEWLILPIFFGRPAEKRDSVERAASQLLEELGRLERLLHDGRTWLAGETISAADLATLSTVELGLRAASRDAAQGLQLAFMPLDRRLPNLAAWLERFRALPSYQTTYPPHWRG